MSMVTTTVEGNMPVCKAVIVTLRIVLECVPSQICSMNKCNTDWCVDLNRDGNMKPMLRNFQMSAAATAMSVAAFDPKVMLIEEKVEMKKERAISMELTR
jgi:hypothetical protein